MQIQSEHYRRVFYDFIDYLELMGYHDLGQSGVKGMLCFLEQQGVLDLAQINSGHIKAHYLYLQQRPARLGGQLSPHTIYGYIQNIRLFLRWAEQTQKISISPMAAMHFPSPSQSRRIILSKAQIKTLYAACTAPIERMTLSLFYGCGLRASEGQNMNLQDINIRTGLLYVRSGKGKKRRIIPMTATVVRTIENYVFEQRPAQVTRLTIGKDRHALALNRVGRRMRQASYRILLKKMLEQAELSLEVSLHNLRHSIATHLLADGMSIERVRDFLGHDSLEATQLYTQVNITQL